MFTSEQQPCFLQREALPTNYIVTCCNFLGRLGVCVLSLPTLICILKQQQKIFLIPFQMYIGHLHYL